jgi:hypothetical protein
MYSGVFSVKREFGSVKNYKPSRRCGFRSNPWTVLAEIIRIRIFGINKLAELLASVGGIGHYKLPKHFNKFSR